MIWGSIWLLWKLQCNKALLMIALTSGTDVACLHLSHRRTFQILTVTQISQNIINWNNFIVKWDTCFRLSPVSWYLPFTRLCRDVSEVWWDLFNDYFITRLLFSPTVKEFFENQSTFGKVMAKSTVSWFLTHRVQVTSHSNWIGNFQPSDLWNHSTDFHETRNSEQLEPKMLQK